MFEKLQKQSFKKAIWGSVFLIIAGLMLAGWMAGNTWYAITGYVPFEQLKPNQIRSQLVDVRLTSNLGYYLEEYEENSQTHRRTTTYLYYLIWTGTDYDTDYRIMTIKVPASYKKSMEAMAENTYNDMLSNPIYFSGKIKKLSSEDFGYFKQYFTDGGISEAEFEANTLPYYIQVYASKASMNGVYILLFVGGAVMLIVGIYRIVKGAKGGYLKKLRLDIANAGYTEANIEPDYTSAQSFDQKDSLKLGRLMTYYTTGTETRAIPNNKIMWAYQNTITHRTNGIKTGTTYNVVLFVEGYKKEIALSVPNEAAAQQMLQKINGMFPWVVVGFSDELKKMFNKERAQFLQLRYNTCEHVAVEPDPYGRTPLNP